MRKNILAGLLYLLITLVVIFSWFHHGLMYGGGDVGLPAYNPQRLLQIVSQPWWTETAPGFPRAQNLATVPAYFFFALLQRLGFPDFMIQAVIFGILLFLMSFGMYLMSKHFLRSENWKIALIAGFFYMVNPYMMVLVWHRFNFTTFLFASSLPFLLLLWREWIRGKKYWSLILFISTNFIFSYMFTTLAFAITLWFLLGLYTLFEILVPWNGKKKAFGIIAIFFLGFFLWILTNAWWICPVIFVLPTLASAQHSVSDTISTLFAIGRQSIIPFSLPGLNSFYLFQRQELGDVFKHPIFLLIPYIGVFFVLVGAYYTRKKRELFFWSILFILAIFLAKGSAPPFGFFYPFFMEKIFFLGVLRNPFEKLGVLIPFASSILFAIGFSNLSAYFWKRNILIGKAIMIFSIGLFFGIYHWPFWTGTLFGTAEKRNFVEIPKDYQQANQWISDQKKKGNILHLPLSAGDSSVYRWRYGYSGLDSNVDFFTSNPSISMRFNLSYLDNAFGGFDIMTRLDQIKYREYFKELFRSFNVHFIIVHYDINWQASGVQSPDKIGKILDTLPFLKKQKDIGELTIYEIDDKSYLGKIYLSQDFNYVIPYQNYTSWDWYLRSNPTVPLLADLFEQNEMTNLPGYNQTILTPTISIETLSKELISEENAVKELPQERFLPDSLFYPFIRLKEFAETLGYKKTKENIHLVLAGKRLVETYKMQNKKPDRTVRSLIERYEQHLNKAVDKIFKDGLITDIRNTSDELKLIFNEHLIVLEKIYQKADEKDKLIINQAISLLKSKMVDMKVFPKYRLLTNENFGNSFSRQIYRIYAPTDGNYEILMATALTSSLYDKNLSQIEFQIDNKIEKRSSQGINDLISFGFTFLNKGEHEISFDEQDSINLFNGKKDVEIASGQHNEGIYEVKVNPYTPDSLYSISFDFWTQKGNEPLIRVSQDSDQQGDLIVDDLSKLRSFQFKQTLPEDPYNKFWKSYKVYFMPKGNTNDLSFQILTLPWDDCKTILVDKKLCDRGEIKYRFQKPSVVSIRNIKVSRVLNNLVFLRSSPLKSNSENITNLDYTKKSPLLFEGNISLDKPEYLLFGETFNKNWELILSDGKKEFKPTKHFLANMYGNGWLLENKGNFKFIIRFSADKYLYIGICISLSAVVIFTIAYFIRKRLKEKYEKVN